ncbi:hypothetical protein [Rheinheimera sp. WS51]|uniref:hypothetical protein n=1 Tax=Rheinheimera sp. WS51 TaxID=3425886 RepID=UPI003D8BB64E
MKTHTLKLILFILLATSVLQFNITASGVSAFSWTASGAISQIGILILVGLAVLKFRADISLKLVFLICFASFYAVAKIFYMQLGVVLSLALLGTSVFYLIAVNWISQLRNIALSAYISTVIFYFVTVMLLSILIYFRMLPQIWSNEHFHQQEVRGLLISLKSLFWGAGPSFAAVAIAYFCSKAPNNAAH